MKFIHCCPARLRLCNGGLLQYATCPCQTGPPQQLMSLKTLRWAVALITNQSCWPPAAAPTAAVHVIDGILRTAPDTAQQTEEPACHIAIIKMM